LQLQYIKGQEEEEEKSTSNDEGMILPHVSFINCPKTSLGVLGNKWTILIIRDFGFLKTERFNRLFESILGPTPLLD
jgi:DNA-binding HxlR family transcriptional regulator